LAQLDTMLRALADRGAHELRLVEGARPAFRFDEGDRPVSQLALSRAQIVALLSEIAPREHVSRLSTGQPTRFAYRHPEGRSFLVEAGGSGEGFQATAHVEEEAGVDPGVTDSEPRPATAAKAPAQAAPLRLGVSTIDAYLTHMVDVGASDLHLSPGEKPMLRLHGEMAQIESVGTCSPEETARLLFPIMNPRYKQEFESTSDTDFAHEIPGVARFRCNVFVDRKGVGAVFRVIPTKVPSAEDLGLGKAITDLCYLTKGLVLVTGPTGSGKSTTLAALVDYVNRNRTDHIITIEDPIEFVHPNRSCLINQREVGTHTESFKKALRAALREDPDIVLVGEMRDLETIAIALETAETGHLVFGTLHTSTAPSTVDRIIDQFPADRQAQIRVMLSESLKGVISQVLCKKIGGGRVAAMEILLGTPAISNLIREGKTFQIPSIMQTARKHGMLMMNDAFVDLVKRKLISPDEAYLKAVDKAGLVSQLRSAGIELGPALAGARSQETP
jgi:twitching motility protein PilT